MLQKFRTRLGIRRPKLLIPVEHRANFRHLYFDIAWFGILNGTILSFLSVFATRAGATNQQIGFIGAAPAVANLIFSIPASMLLKKLPNAKIVFWASIFQRIFYLGFVLLPFRVSSQPLIWAIILGTFILSIPGTGLAVGINALIAQTVPVEWRAHVVGTRNAMLSLFSVAALFISGQLLTVLPFPLNYQVVFAMGFVGALVSSLHLFLIKPPQVLQPESGPKAILPTKKKNKFAHVRQDVRKRIKMANQPHKLTIHALQGKFGIILIILFFFWFSLFLSIPIFPVYQVKVLQLSDRTISLGSSFFQVATFLGATQISRLARKYNNHRLSGIGLSALVLYPLLLPISKTAFLFIGVSALGGVAWSVVNGCLVNYLLEHIPSDDLAGHFAWYNLTINAATLLGSLCGPVIAGEIGLTTALIVFGVGRLLAGLALLRWG